MTNAQVAAYHAKGALNFQLDPLVLAQSGPDQVFNWLRSQDLSKAPLIYTTVDPARVRDAQVKIGVAQVGAMIERGLIRSRT